MEDEADSRCVKKVKVRKRWKMKLAAKVWLSSRKIWVGGGRPAELEPGEASYNPTSSNVHKALGISREVILQAFLGSRSFSQERLLFYVVYHSGEIKRTATMNQHTIKIKFKS